MKSARITERTTFDELPAMLTVQEVAIWLHRSPKALAVAIRKGKAPFSARKFGSEYRVSKMQFQEPKLQTFKR
jgi:hypothetical protein